MSQFRTFANGFMIFTTGNETQITFALSRPVLNEYGQATLNEEGQHVLVAEEQGIIIMTEDSARQLAAALTQTIQQNDEKIAQLKATSNKAGN